ncbi:MAG: hypothetical protein K6A92_05010 [Lachnospiraceae bacterium]|nr:hypothetical protein [Lachnospiraceae bacterium]
MADKYTYTRLSREETEFFEELDPFEKRELLSLPNTFALGVMEKTEGAIRPVGLLLASISEKSVFIEWMLIFPTDQYKGIGEKLLHMVYQTAILAAADQVGALILPEFRKAPFCKACKSFFEERLFTESLSLGADGTYQLADFLETGYGDLSPDEAKRVKAFSLLRSGEKAAIRKKMKSMKKALYTYPAESFESLLDEDLCMVIEEGGELKALFLVIRWKKMLTPVCYFAKEEEDGECVMAAALTAAVSKYGKKQDVFLMMRQEGSKALAEKLLGKVPGAELLLASAKEYKEAMTDAGI